MTTEFLSPPSARRATSPRSFGGRIWIISIPALREEGDSKPKGEPTHEHYFYPRPPRGGRQSRFAHQKNAATFLSPPSARRATAIYQSLRQNQLISIPALREEGDSPRSFGGRIWIISIPALREEGDSKNRDKISIFKQIIQHSARI